MSVEQTAGSLIASLTVGYLATTTQPVVGVEPSIVLAGVVGAAISIILQKTLSTRESLAIAICGTAASIYFTNVVARWMNATEADWLNAISLTLGLAGIYIFRRLSDIVQDPRHVIEAIRSGKLFDLLKTQPRPETPTIPPTP